VRHTCKAYLQRAFNMGKVQLSRENKLRGIPFFHQYCNKAIMRAMQIQDIPLIHKYRGYEPSSSNWSFRTECRTLGQNVAGLKLWRSSSTLSELIRLDEHYIYEVSQCLISCHCLQSSSHPPCSFELPADVIHSQARQNLSYNCAKPVFTFVQFSNLSRRHCLQK
jgi:hypothetical protein